MLIIIRLMIVFIVLIVFFLVFSSQVVVWWYRLQESVTVVLVVDLATVVLQAVAHNQVTRMHHHVVAHDLVEGLLRDVDARALILHDDQRLPRAVGDNGIAAPRDAVLRQRHLVAHQRSWEPLVGDEPLHEVLPHPFLGRQRHPALTQPVPDGPRAVFPLLYLVLICRQIQFHHAAHFFLVQNYKKKTTFAKK